MYVFLQNMSCDCNVIYNYINNHSLYKSNKFGFSLWFLPPVGYEFTRSVEVTFSELTIFNNKEKKEKESTPLYS